MNGARETVEYAEQGCVARTAGLLGEWLTCNRPTAHAGQHHDAETGADWDHHHHAEGLRAFHDGFVASLTEPGRRPRRVWPVGLNLFERVGQIAGRTPAWLALLLLTAINAYLWGWH